MYGAEIFILVSAYLSSLYTAQLMEMYNFKDDCAKRLGTSSYISTCNYTYTHDYYIEKNGKLTDHGTRYLNASRADMENRRSKANLTFTFRYGEVRWRAKMLPVKCNPIEDDNAVLNSLLIRMSYDDRWHLRPSTIDLLMCQFDERSTFVNADLHTTASRRTKVLSCPLYSNPGLCTRYPAVLEGLHNYTLRWTADELTWLIDNVTVFYLQDKRDIPHHMMVLTLSDIDTVLLKRRLNMMVESVSVWQDPAHAGIVSSREYSVVQQQSGEQGKNKTALVEVYSLREKCEEADDNSVDVAICNVKEIIQNYLERNGSFSKSGRKYLEDAVQSAKNSESQVVDEFGFTFGEVRWKAVAFPVDPGGPAFSVLHIEAFETHPANDLQSSVFRSIHLEVTLPPLETPHIYNSSIYASVLRYCAAGNSDFSDSNSTSWTCLLPDCARYALNFNEVHSYTLRWTPDEILWLIDDIPVYRLTDKRKIPLHPMRLPIYDLGDLSRLRHYMMVDSVSVWQNWTSLIQPDFSLKVQDNFTFSHLDERIWRRGGYMYRTRPLSSVVEYSSQLELVSVENRALRLQARYTNGRLSVGRVDGVVKNDLHYPGEVEWRMRFQYKPGFVSVLRIQRNLCNNPGNPGCYSTSVPSFGFACDEWGKVETTLDSEILQYIPDQFLMKIPVDRQRKRNNRFLREGTLDEFHIYRIVWTEEYISWHIDGLEIDRQDLTTQYRLLDEPLTVSMATLLSDTAPKIRILREIRPVLLMEIDDVTLRSAPKIGAGLGQSYDQSTQWKASYTIATITCAFFAVCTTVITTIYWKRRRSNSSHLVASDHPNDAALLHLQSLPPRLADLVTRYTELLEMPENCIDIEDLNSPTTILGKGNYGIVLRGVAKNLRTIQRGLTVAVKILTDNASGEIQKAFSDEVKMLVKAGGHVNVVNILGVVNQGRPFIILEYCKFGSLKSYLRKHQPNAVYVHVDTDDGTLLPFNECGMKNQWLLVDDKNINRNADLSTISSEMLCTGDLIQFSSQISRGMEYLGTRCIIHRDLAARNVLVNERRIVKISDFGLARYAEETYVTEHPNVRMPYLWMPPDAIMKKTFSSKSDVWSFGVLLCEIFTLGEEPFNGPNAPRLALSAFVAWLMQGNQMARPTGSPSVIYDVMQRCWKLNCEDRPTFSELRQALDALALLAVKSDHYVTLADDDQATDPSTDSDIGKYSELVNLQRMIGECFEEAGDLIASHPSTVPDSAASSTDFSYSRF